MWIAVLVLVGAWIAAGTFAVRRVQRKTEEKFERLREMDERGETVPYARAMGHSASAPCQQAVTPVSQIHPERQAMAHGMTASMLQMMQMEQHSNIR